MPWQSCNFESLWNDKDASVLEDCGQLTHPYNWVKEGTFTETFFEYTKKCFEKKLRGFKEVPRLIKAKSVVAINAYYTELNTFCVMHCKVFKFTEII